LGSKNGAENSFCRGGKRSYWNERKGMRWKEVTLGVSQFSPHKQEHKSEENLESKGYTKEGRADQKEPQIFERREVHQQIVRRRVWVIV